MRVRRSVEITKRMAGSNSFEKHLTFPVDTEWGVWVGNMERLIEGSVSYLKEQFPKNLYKGVSKPQINKNRDSVRITYEENGIDHIATLSLKELTLEELKEFNSGYNPEKVEDHFEGNIVVKEDRIEIEGADDLILLNTSSEYETISKYLKHITYTHEGRFYACSEVAEYGKYKELSGYSV